MRDLGRQGLRPRVGTRRRYDQERAAAEHRGVGRPDAIFPSALFLLAPFTEALFLAFSVWCLYAARRGAWPAAAGLGLLAAITRPVGAFLVLPLAWLAYRQMGERGPVRASLPVLAAAAPAAGAAYALYSELGVGRSLFDSARIWGSASFRAPWDVLGASLEWTLGRGDPLQALNLTLLVGSLALLAVGVRRLPIEQTLYALRHLAPGCDAPPRPAG